MNFLPWHKDKKGIIGEKGFRAENAMLPYGIVRIPDANGLVKSRPYYLKKKVDPTFAQEEDLLAYRWKLTYVFPFYCDSLSGGEDLSGNGTKENPYRSLRHLLKNLFGEKRSKKNLFYLLMGAKLCLKIYLKGVVDYDVEFYPFYGSWDERYEFYLKDIYLFVSKWEDGTGREAVVEKIESLTLRYQFFKGISFRNITFLHMGECHFEECRFSGIREINSIETYNSDFARCDIELSSNRDTPFFAGRYFKNCRIWKELLPEEWEKWYFPCVIRSSTMEDCEIYITVKNLFQVNFPLEMTILLVNGQIKRSNFHITATDPPREEALSNNTGWKGIVGVSVGSGPFVDCTLSIAAEHNFAPPPENVTEAQLPYSELYVTGFSGTENTPCIRCKVVNMGISCQNGESRFSGFSPYIKCTDCVSS